MQEEQSVDFAYREEQVIDFANCSGKQDELSTFIDQVEQTTKKLMREVLGLADSNFISSTKRKKVPEEKPRKQTHARPKQEDQRKKHNTTVVAPTAFMRRSEYFEKVKQRNLQDLRRSKQNILEAECTYRPAVNNRRVDVAPLVDRCIDLQKCREMTLFQQRAHAKLQEQRQLNKLTFQPQLNPHASYQSFEEFYEQEVKWLIRRDKTVEKNKQLLEIQEHVECTFQPHSNTKKSPFYHINLKRKGQTKVEDRLHQSLERTMDKRMAKTLLRPC